MYLASPPHRCRTLCNHAHMHTVTHMHINTHVHTVTHVHTNTHMHTVTHTSYIRTLDSPCMHAPPHLSHTHTSSSPPHLLTGTMWPWAQQPTSSSPAFQPGTAFTHTPLPHLPPHSVQVHTLPPQVVGTPFTTTQPSFVGYQAYGEFPHPGSIGYGGQLLTAQVAGRWGERHLQTIQSVPSEGAGVGYTVQPIDEMAIAVPHHVAQPGTPTQPSVPQENQLVQHHLVSPQPSTPQAPPTFPPHANPASSSPFSVDYLLRDQTTVEAVEMAQQQTYPPAQQEIPEAVPTQVYGAHDGSAFTDPDSLGGFPSSHGQELTPTVPPGFPQSTATFTHHDLSQGSLPFAESETSLQVPDVNTPPTFGDKLPAFHLHSDYVAPVSSGAQVVEEGEENMNLLPSEEPFSPPELILTEQEEMQADDSTEMTEDNSEVNNVGYLRGARSEREYNGPPPLVTAAHATMETEPLENTSSPVHCDPFVSDGDSLERSPSPGPTQILDGPSPTTAESLAPSLNTPHLPNTEEAMPRPPTTNVNETTSPNPPSTQPPPATSKGGLPRLLTSVRHRHYDTYSSDDDDVFLPNPLPRPSQDTVKPVVKETREEEPSSSAANEGKFVYM